MTVPEEPLDIVNEKGEVIGSLSRSEIHGNPSLMHRVVHVLIFNSKGELLLQKRSKNKDVAPGRWDTSVGGHVNSGEDIFEAVRREIREELDITVFEAKFLYTYILSNAYESELVYTYLCVYEGEMVFNKDEIDEVRFWCLEEIEENIGKGVFSDSFELEISHYKKFIGKEIR